MKEKSPITTTTPIDRREALRRLWLRRYGYTVDLKRDIGDHWFGVFLESGFIYQGINHPDVWRITEKGKKRCDALFSPGTRWLRIISWILSKYK